RGLCHGRRRATRRRRAAAAEAIAAARPVVMERGDIWWAELGDRGGSDAGFRRPVVVVQADAFNRSRLQTVIAVILTTNLRLVEAPGNVLITAKASGLPRDSVANVSQVIFIDRTFLT